MTELSVQTGSAVETPRKSSPKINGVSHQQKISDPKEEWLAMILKVNISFSGE